MTNAPDTRKTHVVRLAGTNKNGDVLQDIWVDLERIDLAKSATQTADGFWQGYQRKMLWADDPNSDDYSENGPPSRQVDFVKVCSPDEADVDDPEEFVNVPIIRSFKSSGGNGSPGVQKYQDHVRSDDQNNARVVEVRKIAHYDANIDDAAQAAFDADPSLKAFVVPGDQYQRDDSTKDDTQFVDHEIVKFFKPRTQNQDIVDPSASIDRGMQVKLLNQYLIDESDEPDGAVVGGSGINPPYRLDPYQNIVNVKFANDVIVIFTTGDGADLRPLTLATLGRQVTDLGAHLVTVRSFTTQCRAFKVSATAGEFMKMTLARDRAFGAAFALVFTIRGGIEASLDNALTGTAAALTAYPTTFIGPPGMLWFVQLLNYAQGAVSIWKMRYGNHRSDNNPNPPNKMVQCYPLGVDPTVFGGFTTSGYFILGYRLDKKGTGTLYGADTAGLGAHIAPEWHQPVQVRAGPPSQTNFGIPFQDPPPLIVADRT